MPNELQAVGKLKGHKASVVGLCVSASGDTALSSSEDGALRLWDLRTRRGVRAIIAVPPQCTGGAGDDEAPCGTLGSCAFVRPDEPNGSVLVASSSELLAYDLRGSDQIVCKGPPSFRACAGDDINDFAVSPDGCVVAAPCDEGTVELLSATDLKPLRTLRSGHQNICGAARFRAEGGELLTGGFDQKLLLWDPSSGKLRARHEVRELLPPEDPDGQSNPNQLVNPPFVLGLASGGIDDSMAVALGDGAVLALPSSRSLQRGDMPWAVPQAHLAATDGVAWLGAGSSLLASVGRDCALRLWSVGLSSSSAGRGGGGARRRKAGRGGGYASADASADLETSSTGFPTPVAELRLPEKPNAVAAGSEIVLIADTSPEVAVLQVRR